MELRHLRYFVAVAETENVSRAALKLHVSQPALSRQIRDLEDETGFQLFERTAKSVSLTNAGRVFLNDARALLKQADAAVKKAHSVAHPGETEIHVGSALYCSFARSSVMLKRALPIVLAALVIAPALAQSRRTQPGTPMIPPTYAQRGIVAQEPAYFPERFDWQHKKPEDVGMSTGALADAVQLAVAADTPGTHDMALFLKNSFGKEPFDTLIGPIKDRGPASGLITRHGYIVAEWGDPRRVDITNSVTKTFLTTVVGLAWQKGLIHDVNDYVRDYMPPHVDLFESEHNAKIKWDHLLRQTSDWQGTLWGKPDWADRPVGDTPDDWAKRKLWEPGTHFKYNDVRVNVMALAALQVWRRPLPGGAARERDGTDRRLVDVAVVRLRELVGGHRRAEGAVGERRRSLGRRHVHQLLRHGPLRLPVPAQRQVEGPDDRLREVDRDGADAGQRQQDLRLRELVPEHRPQAAAGGAGHRRPLRRQRLEHHLHRLGQRHRRGVPLDQERRGTERRDRQDDVVDAGEDHRGPVRPRFRIASAPLILPAERASLAPGRFCRRLPCHCRPRRRDNETEHCSHESRFRPG